MSNQPSDDLIRELYARFGLAYYQSECLHRELCFIFAWSGLPSPDLITRARVVEKLAQAYTLTLGDVTNKLEGVLPTELMGELQEALETRNFLAHRFWFERAHLMFDVADVQRLIAELDGNAERFNRLDTLVSEWEKPKLLHLGLTEKLLEDCQRQILSGESGDPLPDKGTVRELARKLSGRQRLVRVWELTMGDGGKPLIFELEDGSLWQLSDVGLGWTRFQKVDPKWTEHPSIKLHLPADIIPRPKDIAPWEYEFTLANGAVFWVKPGRQKQTFKWGIRTAGRSSNNQ